MVKSDKAAVKRLNLDMPDDLAAWVSFVAGMRDVSKIAVVNDALRRDMENAPQAVKDAFKAFMAAREVM